MKKALDVFSRQAGAYKKYRPSYPVSLYNQILSKVEHKQSCWDCATGNGQVAMALSEHFDQVYATDISEKQLRHAVRRANIIYKKERAEETTFQNNQFNLVTVAQAMHWLDMEAFNKEAARVLKPGGVIAIWGYGLLRISKTLDPLIDTFCHETIGPYWNEERKHVDTAYANIVFNFEPLAVAQKFAIETEWSREHFKGYLDSWSSVANYKGKHRGSNPVQDFMDLIKEQWDARELKRIEFPIFLKLGRVDK